ncbi:MAG: hypothetical protein ACK518_01970 [bacterium]
MPSEVVIKSGSDFDIDKMFVFYPNVNERGDYVDTSYTKEDLKKSVSPESYKQLKGAIQNKLFNVMADVILHPANFPELVTPTENFHITPLVDKVFEKLGITSKGKERQKTDYKNTDILSREKNINKFISLLKGKRDLGIAAIANTFNVLFQNSNAKADPLFFSRNKLISYFNTPALQKGEGNTITGIDFSDMYDEDGVLKSEFFSEFINAFVDVARDDYVFAVNVVTELSPIIFYMKYMGMSSDKIFYFINQPAIREYTATLSTYQNKFLGVAVGSNPRQKALIDTLKKLGYSNAFITVEGDVIESASQASIKNYLENKDFQSHFEKESLSKSIKNYDFKIENLSGEEKLVQIAMLLELQNLKKQTNSMSEVQQALKFDTSPYSSSFDVYSRSKAYETLREPGKSVLSTATIDYIKKNSMISPLDVANDIKQILAQLFPVRNDVKFNDFLLTAGLVIKADSKNSSIKSDSDLEKYARTAKNDYVNFVLQNLFDKSKEGVEFFQKEFETKKSLNEYLKELLETNKLTTALEKIKGNKELYNQLRTQFPFVENLVIERGENNRSLVSFKFVENGSNPIEKNSVIKQFNDVISLQSPEYQEIVSFFKDLSLYSIVQSGLNMSDISYTNIVPISLVNKLYGYAIDAYKESTKDFESKEFKKIYSSFLNMFYINNPYYIKGRINVNTKDVAKRAKWYSSKVKLDWSPKVDVSKQPAPTQTIQSVADIPQNKVAGVESSGSTVFASPAVVEALGEHAHSIDMIINGLRTRTTRSVSQMQKYSVKVGDIIKHFGKSADGTTKEVYARVTAIHPQGSIGWKGTWEKEGWRKEDVNNIDRFGPGAAAIEFELLDKPGVQPNPLIEAGVKPTVMYGNAAKDIQMATESTQFIGYQSGTAAVSSTNKYREAWGNKANTGSYTSSDVVMVSGSGTFRGVTEDQIRETLGEKYKPLLDKAIAAGASFRVGNQYAKGNLSDQLVAEYLQKKGYTEEKLNGYSRWTKPSTEPINVEQNNTINEFRNSVPSLGMTNEELANMYEQEKLSGESLKEFLQRSYCNGKIK